MDIGWYADEPMLAEGCEVEHEVGWYLVDQGFTLAIYDAQEVRTNTVAVEAWLWEYMISHPANLLPKASLNRAARMEEERRQTLSEEERWPSAESRKSAWSRLPSRPVMPTRTLAEAYPLLDNFINKDKPGGAGAKSNSPIDVWETVVEKTMMKVSRHVTW